MLKAARKRTTRPEPKPTPKTDDRRRSAVGATVVYCGHDATFIADIIEVAGACVVRATGPLRGPKSVLDYGNTKHATHRVRDFPVAGYWNPELGVLVVPRDQVDLLDGDEDEG
ncbi:MAG TPA: hypothetical protein VF183_07305 [Acidimicrobiales bacterium]